MLANTHCLMLHETEGSRVALFGARERRVETPATRPPVSHRARSLLVHDCRGWGEAVDGAEEVFKLKE